MKRHNATEMFPLIAAIRYGDWYLPAIDELGLINNNLHMADLGGFASGLYWSSTEGVDNTAWLQVFGGIQFTNIKSFTNRVRAIRAF